MFERLKNRLNFVIHGSTLREIRNREIESVEIPKSVKIIGHSVFLGCEYLTSVEIPDTVTEIAGSAFMNCKSLRNIVIPDSVKKIDKYAFAASGLRYIDLPRSITEIHDGIFYNCYNLSSVTIPDAITRIGSKAFSGCESLTDVVVPTSVTEIGDTAFSGCRSLKSIVIPNSVSIIKYNTFYGCANLRDIAIPDSVTEIEYSAFSACKSLTNVVIPDSVKKIGDYAFSECESLKSIVLPNSIDKIDTGTFYNCQSLTSIVIPSSVTKIRYKAFNNCSSLTSIVIPDSVTEIEDQAFAGCTSLENLVIPETVKRIGDKALDECYALDITFNIVDDCYYNSSLPILGEPFTAVLTKTDDKFTLRFTKDKVTNLDKNQKIITNPYLINYYMHFFDDKKTFDMLNTVDKDYARYLYTKDFEMHCDGLPVDYNGILFKNIKSINNFVKAIKSTDPGAFDTTRLDNKFALFKLCENLGVLNDFTTTVVSTSKSGKTKTQQIDYAQKAREFLKDRIADASLPLRYFNRTFDSMKPYGFKQEFADFFLNKNNFEELMEEERHEDGFIARCYNEFELVQSTHTSQRGSQRQLAPTVEYFKQYFTKNKFSGVTPETLKIATTVSQYFTKQKDFDKAVEIDEERKKKRIPDNILGDEIIQEETVFEKVDSLLKETKNIAIDATSTLVDLASRKFTYEFLRKSDPTNFVLGKLCSCCSHLEGAGNGIMHASIVHPNVQNIVIRDKSGNIVAKSTLYVNRKEGYGVCNNVEVNIHVEDEDKQLIYQKYKKAIETFANRYNKKYPNKPLKIITVGMHLNDLRNQIESEDTKSKKLYHALDYGKYGYDDSHYSGDSGELQYVVWQNTDLSDGQTL